MLRFIPTCIHHAQCWRKAVQSSWSVLRFFCCCSKYGRFSVQQITFSNKAFKKEETISVFWFVHVQLSMMAAAFSWNYSHYFNLWLKSPSIHLLYPLNPSVGLRGGWSLSQQSLGERRGSPWTGRQSITGPHRDKPDKQPLTLTPKDNLESPVSTRSFIHSS